MVTSGSFPKAIEPAARRNKPRKGTAVKPRKRPSRTKRKKK